MGKMSSFKLAFFNTHSKVLPLENARNRKAKT